MKPTLDPSTDSAAAAAPARTGRVWDGLGIALSSLCLVHCLAPVLLASTITVFGIGGDGHGMFHQGVFLAASVIGLLAFLPGFKHHRSWTSVGLAAAGFGLLFIGAYVAHDVWGHEAEMPLTVAGGLTLIGAHAVNIRACRKGPTPCADDPCS
ncbi:MAG: MerC domain-containing protein [Planctomycetota bacterium]|jgi:hypothetical protein